ncbi:hypothetical protein [Mycolicibacterium lutetiense]|uniref:Lipoprotein n=1 Tax=Mycolicibacterium lutetiense TaxID=1641992 RepID=A0ABS4ZLI0_9MYCO|nr:hypothetical protein [Mycolicibacterium lutetiense]MBP2450357.1 hypothetical protein [Mycolicibacterium lutetiense]
MRTAGRLVVCLIAFLAACAPAGRPSDGKGFPDFSGYTPADHDTYFSGGQRYSGYSFRTPSGLTCDSNDYLGPEYARIQCWGPRPDKGPGLWLVAAERRSAATIRQLTDPDDPQATPPPLLPAQHVVRYPKDDLVCGVGSHITACRIGRHGFVLGPKWSRFF